MTTTIDRTDGPAPAGRRLPLPVKILYTLFVAVLVPSYWSYYGPANFLWFSDIALLLTLFALWLESPFLASMQAVAVVFLELLWVVDFAAGLLFGKHPLGLSSYMFEPERSAYLRG